MTGVADTVAYLELLQPVVVVDIYPGDAPGIADSELDGFVNWLATFFVLGTSGSAAARLAVADNGTCATDTGSDAGQCDDAGAQSSLALIGNLGAV